MATTAKIHHPKSSPATGVVYDRVRGDPERYDGAVRIDGMWCLPNRRHLTPPVLRRELETAGFRVVRQGGKLGGDLICVRAGGDGYYRDRDERRPAATFRRFAQTEERLP